MKRFLFLVSLLSLSLCMHAQSSKQKLGFIPYSDPAADKNGYRQMAYDYLYEAATRIFINTQRFDILDRSKFDLVKIEKNFTKGDDFINSEIVAQGKALAAEVLAVAKVTALSVSQSEDQKGWSAFFTVELKQIDVETTKALNALQLKGEFQDDSGISIGDKKVGNVNRARSPEQAISKVVSKMEESLNKWIRDNFPVKMEVLDRNDAGKVLYARGGKDMGLTLRSNMCLRRIHRLKTGDIIAETISELKFTKADGVGDATTKFELKNSKEWDKVVQALTDYPDEVFIMENPNSSGILKKVGF